MNNRHFTGLTLLLLVMALTTITGCQRNMPNAETVVGAIHEAADLATTELKVRKVAVYDSDNHEHFDLTDPTTWKLGERKCVVPVEATLTYGYDWSQITVDRVRIDEERRVLEVRLPAPKLIDAGYAEDVDESQVVCIATGLRDPIGHELIEQVKQEAFEQIKQEDYCPLIASELRTNAEVILTTIARQLGYERAIIIDDPK